MSVSFLFFIIPYHPPFSLVFILLLRLLPFLVFFFCFLWTLKLLHNNCSNNKSRYEKHELRSCKRNGLKRGEWAGWAKQSIKLHFILCNICMPQMQSFKGDAGSVVVVVKNKKKQNPFVQQQYCSFSVKVRPCPCKSLEFFSFLCITFYFQVRQGQGQVKVLQGNACIL